MSELAQAVAGHVGRRASKVDEPETVASIATFRNGKLLMGQRRDDGKWCCPGGHLEPGEGPEEGARRELTEETGLSAKALKQLGSKRVKNGEILVHSFRADVDGSPSNTDDPDAEFKRFRWVDHRNLPDDISGALHNNPDVTLRFLESEPEEADESAPYGDLLREEKE